MTLPFTLPDWLPWWAALVIFVPLLLYLLALLAMPFSVLGVRGRLDLIEARLDELHGEIRALVVRLPAARHDDAPPIPPAVRDPLAAPDPETPARMRRRSEPRLDWPR
jgi:hypothetical protein